MPNLDFSLVFLCRAPILLEVHLPYFRSIGTYNMLFSVKGCVCVWRGPQKIQGPNFTQTLQTAQIKNGDSCCLLLKRKMGHLFYPFVKKTQNNNPKRLLLQSCCALESWILLVLSTEEALFFQSKHPVTKKPRIAMRSLLREKYYGISLLIIQEPLL